MAVERADAAEANNVRLKEKLSQLGSSHDTMYALLFKSKRLSNMRPAEEAGRFEGPQSDVPLAWKRNSTREGAAAWREAKPKRLRRGTGVSPTER